MDVYTTDDKVTISLPEPQVVSIAIDTIFLDALACTAGSWGWGRSQANIVGDLEQGVIQKVVDHFKEVDWKNYLKETPWYQGIENRCQTLGALQSNRYIDFSTLVLNANAPRISKIPSGIYVVKK